jgi:peptidoglycan/xylan/chitin deacetylase (PgdA/CDA1 family)
MLSVLDRYAIPCTVSLNVAVLDHYPEIGAAMAERAWDLMSHGLYNTRYLTGMDVAEERAFLEACNEVLRRHTGRAFAGMLGPNITATGHTPDLMAEAGMRFYADCVHDERPTPFLTSSGAPLVALPYSYELNDAPLLMRSHVEGEAYLDLCRRQLERLREEAADGLGGRIMCLPLHPFAIGQPHRIGYLDRLMALLRRHDDVWVATASDIVDHYLGEGYYDDDLAQAGAVSRG